MINFLCAEWVGKREALAVKAIAYPLGSRVANKDGDPSTVATPRTLLAAVDEVQVIERLGPIDHRVRQAHQLPIAYLTVDGVRRFGHLIGLGVFVQDLTSPTPRPAHARCGSGPLGLRSGG